MNLDELEQCFKALVWKLRADGLDSFEAAPNDFYWVVTSPDWLEMSREPKPAVGSLIDDCAVLTQLANDPSRATAVDLERLASVLRLLSDRLAASDAGERSRR